jgi:hypothetical protein
MTESDIAMYVCKTTVSGSCLTQLSYINMTGDCGGVLPVALQVNGRKTTKGNLLTWNIEGGQASAVYTIERKTAHESSYKTIATGGYTFIGANKYSFVDQQPVNGTNLYRVKKTSGTGVVEYSNTLAIENSTTSIDVYPNPVKASFTVTIHSETPTNYAIGLYTIDGRMLFQKQLFAVTDWNNTYATPAGLQPGTYVLRISNQSTGITENRKLLFQ